MQGILSRDPIQMMGAAVVPAEEGARGVGSSSSWGHEPNKDMSRREVSEGKSGSFPIGRCAAQILAPAFLGHLIVTYGRVRPTPCDSTCAFATRPGHGANHP